MIAQLVKNPPAIQETPISISWLGRSAGEGIGHPLQYSWASLVVQLVKNLPTMQETLVQSLGWEDPSEKGKATDSSILASRILDWLYSPWRCKQSVTTERVSLSSSQNQILVHTYFWMNELRSQKHHRTMLGKHSLTKGKWHYFIQCKMSKEVVST